MSESIIIDIQAEAIDENFPISNLLLKSYAVSEKLELSEFSSWAINEINGYGDCYGQDLPEYRCPKGSIRAFNGRGWTPVMIPDSEVENIISKAYCFESIAQIEDLLEKMEQEVYFKLTGDQCRTLSDLTGFRTEYAIFVSRSSLKNISNKVRTFILDWALKLEKNGVKGDGIQFSSKEKELAKVVNNYFGDVNGIIGNVNNSNVSQSYNINKGDTHSLINALKSKDVEDSDIDDLIDSINKDGQDRQENAFGNHVSSWVGNMLNKAANGTWGIGMSAAGSFLGDVLGKYYGL